MTEKEIDEIRIKLRVNNDGELRKLWYAKNGLPKQVMLSNSKILESIDIDMSKYNSLEQSGILKILTSALSILRNQAKKAGLPWVDWGYRITQTRRRIGGDIYDAKVKIAMHGYIKDNAVKFETMAGNVVAIAILTREIATITETVLITKKRSRKGES